MQIDKENLANSVKYEFKMFTFLYGEIRKRKKAKVGTGNDSEEDAFLESFLLHTRVLRDFFCNTRTVPSRKTKCPKCNHTFDRSVRKNDDILALDFVDSWDQKPCVYLKKLRDPLNKLLAHLTPEREKYTLHSYFWDPEKIHQHIQSMIDEFLERLPCDHKTWFQ